MSDDFYDDDFKEYTFNVLVLCSSNDTIGNVSSPFFELFDVILYENDIDPDNVHYTYVAWVDAHLHENQDVYDADIREFNFLETFEHDSFDVIILQFCPKTSYITVLS